MRKLTLVIALCLSGCYSSDNTLRLGVTTTLEDSGLLDVMVQEAHDSQHLHVQAIVAGSGQLLALLERGDIDLAISHEPDGEKKLLSRGTITARIPLFYNYFLLAGPTTNPAQLTHTMSIQTALKQIAHSKSPFVSRSDNSGTHKTEQSLFNRANMTIATPYLIKTGTGMGESLHIAAQQQAYILVDLGTWLNFNNKQSLAVLWDEPLAITNAYHLLVLPKPKRPKLTQAFTHWLRSDNGQQLVSQYRIQHQPVFFLFNPQGKKTL